MKTQDLAAQERGQRLDRSGQALLGKARQARAEGVRDTIVALVRRLRSIFALRLLSAKETAAVRRPANKLNVRSG